MNFDKPITRRESIRRLLRWSGTITLAGTARLSLFELPRAWAAAANKKFIVEGIGQTDGFSVNDLTKKVFEAAGGMRQFVSKGDVVVIKPNISWARPPHLAATTNPEVLQAVVELCQEAGAKKVRIADNTLHDARQCFALTGAGMVAKNTGADLIFPRASLMRTWFGPVSSARPRSSRYAATFTRRIPTRAGLPTRSLRSGAVPRIR